MGDTDLLASPTRAAESLAPGSGNGSRRFENGMIPTGRSNGHFGQK